MNVGQLNFSGHFQAAGYAGDIIRRKFPQAAQLKIQSGDWDLDIEYPDHNKDLGRKLMMLLVGEGVNFKHARHRLYTGGHRVDYSPSLGGKFHEQTPARLKNRMERLINAGQTFQYNRPDPDKGPNARVSYRA